MLAKDGALTGLSIGYHAKEQRYENDVRVLSEIDVLETSLVTFPMNDFARINAVKSQLRTGTVCDRSDLFYLLKTAGLTRRQALRLLDSRYAGMTPQHAAADFLARCSTRLET